MPTPTLLAVPNVSEGRDPRVIAKLRNAFATDGVKLLDVHSDPDHHRSVFTLAGPPRALADAVLAGARTAVDLIDVVARARLAPEQAGQHPHVGALDVAPVVYLEHSARGAACAEALVIGDRLGAELGVPVFLYGELTAHADGAQRTRALLRCGGVAGLAERMRAAAGQSSPPGAGQSSAPGAFEQDDRSVLVPDFGPHQLHPRAGATLVAARPPLVAFNLQLAPPADLHAAQRIAATIREGGQQGLNGVRAIGVLLTGGVAQVSTNVERPLEVPLAAVAQAVAQHAPVASAELVGLAPRAALDGFPREIEIAGFDPGRQLIENAIG